MTTDKNHPPNPFHTSAPAARKVLPNPFGPAAPVNHEATGPQYGIVASGPPVAAEEVETEQGAIEVMVLWGDESVLRVEHLAADGEFVVGETNDEADVSVDYLIASDALGAANFTVCRGSDRGVEVFVPEGATATLTPDGGSEQSVAPAGASLTLSPGDSARVAHRGFTFIVRSVRAAKRVGDNTPIAWAPLSYMAGVFGLVAIMALVFYFSPPHVSALNSQRIDPSSRLANLIIMGEATVEPPQETPTEQTSGQDGDDGGAAAGPEGVAGDQDAPDTHNHGDRRGNDNVTTASPQSDADRVANSTIVSTLADVQGLFTGGPSSPFGPDQILSSGDVTAIGGVLGAQAGSGFGLGGLGVAGTARGGGGPFFGALGVGNLRPGRLGGPGAGPGGTGRGREGGLCSGSDCRESNGPPRVVISRPRTRGSLSADVIRRVVSRRVGEVRHCYEQGLVSQPDLAGRVTMRWMISGSGAVSSSVVGSSSLGNQRVEQCMSRAVRRWSFPAPSDGGVVSVTYPFTLRSN